MGKFMFGFAVGATVAILWRLTDTGPATSRLNDDDEEYNLRP